MIIDFSGDSVVDLDVIILFIWIMKICYGCCTSDKDLTQLFQPILHIYTYCIGPSLDDRWKEKL